MREMPPLERGKTYHLYNRGTNGENIFIETRNYPYFLKRWQDLVAPVTETYAFCLLRNHFHFLVRIKPEEVIDKNPFTGEEKLLDPSNQLSKFFNSYAQSINRGYKRTGSLFEHPVRRKEVASDFYFSQLLVYIHFNPQKHGFVDNYRDWPYSSYGLHINQTPTFINRNEVKDWFGSEKRYIEFHESFNDFKSLNNFTEDLE
jgi:putative transposase